MLSCKFCSECHCIVASNQGALLTVFLCVLVGGERAAMVAPYLEALTTARSAAAKIFRIIERKPSIDSSSESGKRPDKMVGAISFKEVVFSYPSRPGVPILKDFSLEVFSQDNNSIFDILVLEGACWKDSCSGWVFWFRKVNCCPTPTEVL